MVDFSHLANYDVSADSTAEYTLYELEGEPVLIVRPANDKNKKYFNSVLKSSARMAQIARVGKITAKILNENREQDRELFPKFVIIGWKGVLSATRKDVPFNADNCAQFIAALPNQIFDGLRQFAASPGSFITDADEIGIEDQAKNS